MPLSLRIDEEKRRKEREVYIDIEIELAVIEFRKASSLTYAPPKSAQGVPKRKLYGAPYEL
jgi:hypothetical protein